MDLLEASKDNGEAQSDSPGAVYAPLHPLIRSGKFQDITLP